MNKVKVCKCPHPTYSVNQKGIRVTHHQDLSLHNPDLFYELNNSAAYKKNFKDYCIICKSPIPKEWSHYRDNGNFCTRCRTRINNK